MNVTDELRRLPELARNLWWTWHPEGHALMDPLLQQSRLDGTSRAVETARDPEFIERYRRALVAFDAVMSDDRKWFPAMYGHLGPGPIAYFSAEFGVHNALPVYSGGLGVLAGDFAKEASDLGVPLIGVGFMYPQGYFRQRVSPEGRQEEIYEYLDKRFAPIAPACVVPGRSCLVRLELPDRVLHVAVWVVRVGRVSLYLMDTDLAANAWGDRELSARLYGGDQEMRLRQEILLGIGGVRLLRAQGIRPAVWHANEGHSAFMMLERVRELLARGRDLDEAVAEVRTSTVFTTHTPVPAGHDAFPLPLIEKYLEPYWARLGSDRDRFVALGRHEETWGPAFNMTALALRLAQHCNAVSLKHGEVSRRMWASLWNVPEKEAPIIAITNGVHVLSWAAPEFVRAYRAHGGEEWMEHLDSIAAWRRAASMPDVALWTVHRQLKLKLLGFMRARARARWQQDGVASAQVVAGGTLFDPEVLTIGFARRFATYKRAFLLFTDPDRLKALLTDPRRPLQVVFAGKAHPADEPGKRILQTVYGAATDPAFAGRIAFIDDYDIHVAQHVVQGVDVWLNTPRPPLEASGTSGQKAALNGVPSLSTLDGWWAEAHDGTNGWAIPEPPERSADVDAEDARDAEALYRLLEDEVVPLYYERGLDGLPARWIRVMRRTIETIAPVFNARRMMKEYVNRLYAPAWASAAEFDDVPHPTSSHFHDGNAVATAVPVGPPLS